MNTVSVTDPVVKVTTGAVAEITPPVTFTMLVGAVTNNPPSTVVIGVFSTPADTVGNACNGRGINPFNSTIGLVYALVAVTLPPIDVICIAVPDPVPPVVAEIAVVVCSHNAVAVAPVPVVPPMVKVGAAVTAEPELVTKIAVILPLPEIAEVAVPLVIDVEFGSKGLGIIVTVGAVT